MDIHTQQTQLLKYLNLARENPTHYITLIQSQLSSFINNKDLPLSSSKDIIYQTIQGRNALIQAKHFLLKQKPIPALKKHNALCKVSTEHQKDICKTGKFQHIGSDGSDFHQRIWRHCERSTGAMVEIIGLDFDIKGRNWAEFTVLGLIIDDGISGREHRKTIFNPVFRYVGWSTGKYQEKIVTIFNLLENNFDQITPKRVEGNKQNKENKENIGVQANSMTTTKKRFKKVFGVLVPMTEAEINILESKNQQQQSVSPFFKPNNNQATYAASSSKSASSNPDNTPTQTLTATPTSTPNQIQTPPLSGSTPTPTGTSQLKPAINPTNTHTHNHAHTHAHTHTNTNTTLSQKQQQSTQNNDNITLTDHNEIVKHQQVLVKKIAPVTIPVNVPVPVPELVQSQTSQTSILQQRQLNIIQSQQKISQKLPTKQKKGIKLVRRISQKHQNTKTTYEDNATIIEITTKIVYQDGSQEIVVDRKITYDGDDHEEKESVQHAKSHNRISC